MKKIRTITFKRTMLNININKKDLIDYKVGNYEWKVPNCSYDIISDTSIIKAVYLTLITLQNKKKNVKIKKLDLEDAYINEIKLKSSRKDICLFMEIFLDFIGEENIEDIKINF